MKKSKCRYTDVQLRSMGYEPLFDSNPINSVDSLQPSDLPVIAAGGFDGIMKVIFENDDGSLPNLLKVSVNENTPDSVRQFVNNVLSANITAFKSAPDDDTAFDMICPRGCSLEQYEDMIKNSISRYKREFDAKSSKSD